MNKKQEEKFIEKLEILLDNIEEIYKLSALTVKFCEQNKDSDDLYEISSVAKIIEKQLDTYARQLYSVIHMYDKPFMYREMGERMKELL